MVGAPSSGGASRPITAGRPPSRTISTSRPSARSSPATASALSLTCDWSKESSDTLREIEAEIIGMFKSRTTQEKGEFMIAGSGVAAYDFPLIKEKMPELASYFSYFSLDVGMVRRAFNIFSGGADLVPIISESFVEGNKKHRALEDIKAHLKEANQYRKFLRNLADQQKEN